MHGRLKVKTTAEQAAEKQKEREEKRKLYLGGLTKVFSKRSSNTHDEEGLKMTAQLLTANPDAATLWNFRREILLNMKGNDDEVWSKVLMGELSMVEHCLMKNHKSYGAWHHRSWTMEHFPTPPWEAELELCNKYLKLDERNFHCWDYRRFVTRGSQKEPEEELTFSKELIENNMSNFSAWHYRSKILPVVYPPSTTIPHPIPVEILVQELKTVVEAVFTDPCDQSPWFFLRWLLNIQEKSPRLLEIGYINKGEGKIVLVFSKSLGQNLLPSLSVNNEIKELDWYTPSGENYSYVWVANLSLHSEEDTRITVNGSLIKTRTITVPAGSDHFVEWVTSIVICGDELCDLTRSTLEEVKENCITLDELDPGNKWVLLTLVDILWALDARNYMSEIKDYLSQLQNLDQLRKHYYADMKSKLIMETSLTKQRKNAEKGAVFKLSESSLTCVTFSHLLACATNIDLRCNELTSIQSLKYLVMCQELNIDDNNISDLSPLRGLKYLRNLSVANNCIKNIEQLKDLQDLKSLVSLDLTSNSICDIPDIEVEIKKLFPSLEILKII